VRNLSRKREREKEGKTKSGRERERERKGERISYFVSYFNYNSRYIDAFITLPASSDALDAYIIKVNEKLDSTII